MPKKVLVFFLNLLLMTSVSSKPAPSNTFKFTDTAPVSVDRTKVASIQDKIKKLQAEQNQNFFIEKINEFRISRLKNDLKQIRN